MLIDTGSSVNIIDKNSFEKVAGKIKTLDCNRQKQNSIRMSQNH